MVHRGEVEWELKGEFEEGRGKEGLKGKQLDGGVVRETGGIG